LSVPLDGPRLRRPPPPRRAPPPAAFRARRPPRLSPPRASLSAAPVPASPAASLPALHLAQPRGTYMVRMLAVICWIALLGAADPSAAQAPAPITKLTLDDALTLARAANPTIRAKEYELQAAGAHEVQAALRP